MASVRRTSSVARVRKAVTEFPAKAERTGSARPARPGDRVEATEEARALARARERVQAAPEIRAEKVRRLKEQIARGEYKPDPREVARKILEHGLDA
ncbi:MAG: hypothetical protein Kow0010_19490 [Dehalococcoidia bacterium]